MSDDTPMDLTHEGLRAQAREIVYDGLRSCPGLEVCSQLQITMLETLILAAFTALVASARADERAGLLRAFHVTLDALGAPPDDWPCNRAKYLVAEARRAQREEDARLVADDDCVMCHDEINPFMREHLVDAIRAQEET